MNSASKEKAYYLKQYEPVEEENISLRRDVEDELTLLKVRECISYVPGNSLELHKTLKMKCLIFISFP